MIITLLLFAKAPTSESQLDSVASCRSPQVHLETIIFLLAWACMLLLGISHRHAIKRALRQRRRSISTKYRFIMKLWTRSLRSLLPNDSCHYQSLYNNHMKKTWASRSISCVMTAEGKECFFPSHMLFLSMPCILWTRAHHKQLVRVGKKSAKRRALRFTLQCGVACLWYTWACRSCGQTTLMVLKVH